MGRIVFPNTGDVVVDALRRNILQPFMDCWCEALKHKHDSDRRLGWFLAMDHIEMQINAKVARAVAEINGGRRAAPPARQKPAVTTEWLNQKQAKLIRALEENGGKMRACEVHRILRGMPRSTRAELLTRLVATGQLRHKTIRNRIGRPAGEYSLC